MARIKNPLGMSALISHPEQKSIEEQMRIFKAAGFDSFFLSYGVTDAFERIPYWAKCAKQIGIVFEAVHAPSSFVNSVWLGDDGLPIYKSATEKLIDDCSDGEVTKLILHTGTDPSLKPTEQGLAFWRNLESYAKARGVRLCYENANTPLLFEAVASSVDPFHGVCHDIGHQLCYTPQKDYIRMFGDKILYTHIHDNVGDGRDMHLLPQDGCYNFNSYFEKMQEIQYDGTLNLELSCYHSESYRNMPFEKFVETSFCRLQALTSGSLVK